LGPASVLGFNTAVKEMGPIFELPITVLRSEDHCELSTPAAAAQTETGAIAGNGVVVEYPPKTFAPGERWRHFVEVPKG
jgi:hypothetical protein